MSNELTSSATQDLSVIAETTEGKVRGSAKDGCCIFKGIRYGETTAGGNRFLPSRPPQKWSGLRDAMDWGPSAPQSPVPQNTDPFYSWYSEIQTISEDCLFLNVFTPGVDHGKRPVMFWIHGGGWRNYSGTAPGFNGTNLARDQDVVVVTINHRLNAFGCLYLTDPDERFADAGNAGLLDIVSALKWVCDNAQTFGGDPNNITIFGQSGGASKVVALLAMPAASGLFHKAIIQSTAGGMTICDQEEAVRHSANLAKAIGRAELDGEELQKIPMDTIIPAVKAAGGQFRSVIDGRNFTDQLYAPNAPTISSEVPLLIGCVNTETTYHLNMDPSNSSLNISDVRRRLARYLKVEAGQVDRIIEGYQSVFPTLGPRGILVAVTSDFQYRRNALRIAELHAARKGAPVYFYNFCYEAPVGNGQLGTPHTGDVPFIFGTTTSASAMLGTSNDLGPMTKRMMACWASFARHGTPNNHTIPNWAPFEKALRKVMMLDVESRIASDPGGTARQLLDELPYFDYQYSLAHFVRD